MTAETFTEIRGGLPDGGQWSELIRGVPVSLQPPDLDHGTIVLNLSKALGAYVHSSLNGYPCFDLGLKVEDRPDTVLFPAISYFLEGERFSEADKEYTETTPVLVVDLATTSDRRGRSNERVNLFLDRGVQRVWLVDPQQRAVFVANPGRPALRLTEFETLVGDPFLQGFQIRVSDLFVEPEWANR